MMDDFTLCQNNNFVAGNLKELKKYINRNGCILTLDAKVIDKEIDECLKDLRVMKKQGQSLEKRCKKYRKSVEPLGFERKK